MMKKIPAFALLLIVFAFLIGCHCNDDTCPAIVEKFDTNKCACCGGLIVRVDGKTYQAYVYPENISPEVKKEYPYAVEILYTLKDASESCSIVDGVIDISEAHFD
ncbi:MAG: hypothetical protein IPN29_20075 [Saprospiraceae bacterium]|nr:hypothetical protein [Saprospiraceae bacterium]